MPGATAPTLDEPRTGRLTIQYAPDAETPIVENPPRFTWLPVIEDEALMDAVNKHGEESRE